MSNKLYRYSYRIVVLGRDMRPLVLKKIDPQNAEKIVMIPNWSDIEDVYPLPRTDNTILKTMNLSNKWVITYAGNMGRTHGLDNIIKAAKKINRVEADIHFVMCGTGAKRSWLEAEVKKESLSNVTLLPSQPRAELNNLLNACDVAIISFMPGMAGVSVPSRMYNVLAAGKPIIAVADPTSELALVIKEEEVGWVIPPDQPDLLAEAIETAWMQRTCLKTMGENARAAAESKYTLSTIIAKYISLFTEDVSGFFSPSSNRELIH
jgi:colanic acid biosynthesis glycosyl transferase WcaI